jgi:probable rRNA maturation factor
MKINLEINNKVQSPVEEDFLRVVGEKTGEEINLPQEASVSLALVSPEEIKKLNGEYRSQAEVTDVLSFPEYANQEALAKASGKELFLGEIILCYDEIERYAQEQKRELQQELAEVFAHGILHLVGFEHGEEMFARQKKVANNFD